jgi:hypothetical protein
MMQQTKAIPLQWICPFLQEETASPSSSCTGFTVWLEMCAFQLSNNSGVHVRARASEEGEVIPGFSFGGGLMGGDEFDGKRMNTGGIKKWGWVGKGLVGVITKRNDWVRFCRKSPGGFAGRAWRDASSYSEDGQLCPLKRD